ncbi:MAG: hypothetical protein HN976_31660 [Lentisphaerae bacterium]|jgi:hypothetical protein|nr:hypothetical protein [Lentisphaerota bacterium]MBT7059697.1 hypothetical protein [Lentisphaerota bacterium]
MKTEEILAKKTSDGGTSSQSTTRDLEGERQDRPCASAGPGVSDPVTGLVETIQDGGGDPEPGLAQLVSLLTPTTPKEMRGSMARSKGDHVKYFGHFVIGRGDPSRAHKGHCPEERHLLQDHKAMFSGIVWRDGYRNTANFQSFQILMVDCDDGVPTIEEVLDVCVGKVYGVLHTTRHHLLPKKNDPARERYRLWIPLDRPIEDLETYFRFVNTMHSLVFPRSDRAMMTAVFRCRGGVSDSKIRGFGGDHCISVGKVLHAGKERGIDALSAKQQSHVLQCLRPSSKDPRYRHDVDYSHVDAEKANGNYHQALDKVWRKTDWNTDDTYARMYGMMKEAFKLTLDFEIAKATLYSWQPFTDWLSRHENQEHCIDDSLLDARWDAANESLQHHAELLQPINPLVTLKAGDLPTIPDTMAEKMHMYCGRHEINDNRLLQATAKLVHHSLVRNDQRKLILSVPCGMGKSMTTTCAVAAYADQDNRFLIVKPTIDDCIAQRQELVDLGVSQADITVLMGFREDHCHAGHADTEWRTMYDTAETPCKACEHRGRCDFALTLLSNASQLAKPVVIASHNRFNRLWEFRQIHPDFTIIVDEALANSEQLNLTQEQFEAICDISEFLERHRHQVEAIGDGVEEDTFELSATSKRHILRFLEDGPDPEADCEADDTQTSNQGDRVNSYLNFFSGGSERYVIKTERGFHWIKRHHRVDLPNRVIFLDGSAVYSQVEWEGFVINAVEEHREVSFDNLTVHAQAGNPTKKRLKKKDEFAGFQETVLNYFSSSLGAVAFFALNKDGKKKLPLVADLVRQGSDVLRPELVILERGKILGSNEANHCDVAVICTSIFTSVSDYALRTALAEGGPVGADRIWKYFRRGKAPLMKSDGFVDSGLNDTFRRHYANELYQYLMRIRLRTYKNENCHAFFFCSGYWLLRELDRMLPGFSVEGDGSPTGAFRSLENMTLKELENLSVRDLQDLCGGSTSVRGTKELRRKRNFEWLSRIHSRKGISASFD